jgi:hypothetical protein
MLLKTDMLIRALICPFFGPISYFSPARRGAGFSKSTGSPLGWRESHFRTAESNLDALNTVDLGPKRPFCVGECALWARLTGPQFAAQVGAVVGLVEAPVSHYKSTAVVKEVMAIKYGNTTGNSIKKFLESPFAGKHPKLISKGTKAAAAEAAVPVFRGIIMRVE